MEVMKVRKAVFPAAGLGTRFLPATKAMPKEMLPLVDKPLIQYGVEEAVAAGCDEIIFVTGRGKSAMEDHFDRSPDLEAMLEMKGKDELLKIARSVSSLAKITYVRQAEALGLGHAVLQAKWLVGNEPFAVILADDVVDSKVSCIKQMVERMSRQGRRSWARRLWRAQRSRPMAAWIARRMQTIRGCWRCATWSRNRRPARSRASTRLSGDTF